MGVTFFIAKKVTMLRHACTHPCATAQQPWFDLLSLIHVRQLTNQNLVPQKTRIISFTLACVPVLLARFFVFQNPISFKCWLPNRVLYLHEIGIYIAQTVLGHMITPIRNDFLILFSRNSKLITRN